MNVIAVKRNLYDREYETNNGLVGVMRSWYRILYGCPSAGSSPAQPIYKSKKQEVSHERTKRIFTNIR